MNPQPASHEDVRKLRILRLLQTCLDVSLGTVWRVREDLWRERFQQQDQRYDQHGTRTWHPAVSLRQGPLTSLHEIIPMLHGSTGDGGPVVVRGLTRERGSLHATSFGRVVRPAKITATEITSPAPDAKRDTLTGSFFERQRVFVNFDKPRLAEVELADLRTWAQKRGLL